jgi:protein O-GlcNAc transferase
VSSEEEAERLIARGNQAETEGRLHEAHEHYRRAVAIAPGYAKAQLNLGVGLEAIGDAYGASEAYGAALAIDPANAYASYNLGKLLYTRGALPRAEQLLHSALKHRPEFPEAQVVLSSVYEAQGKLNAAAAALEVALTQRPDWPGALSNYGTVMKKLGRLAEAELALSRVIAIDGENAEACYELAVMLQARGALPSAERLFHMALDRNAKLLKAHDALGGIYKDRGDFLGAENHFRKLIELQPDHPRGHYLLGDALFNRGDRVNALDAFGKALTLRPGFFEARWARTMAQIPAIYGDECEIAVTRTAFGRDMAELQKWVNDNGITAGHEAVASIPPFYLAYTEENNRDLLAHHGNLCAQLMGDWLRAFEPAEVARIHRDRIEVGIVSAHVFDHSVWNAIIKGWVQNLDTKRFSVSIFHLGTKSDHETMLARSFSAHFELGGKSVEEWVRSILSRRPDVLIYAEIGMDPTTLKLASLRLAPIQAATWGHPETTGLPTMDYYLSADGLEPAGAQAHYTESLVKLPGFGVYYQPLPVPYADGDLQSLGIDSSRPVLLNPGTPFKYSPRYDNVLVEIVRRLDDCQLIFFAASRADLTALLCGRLRAAFSSCGLDFDRHAKFTPWLDRIKFHGLMRRADVFLDPIGFSGFNTAIQAVECGLPIVTREGRFMRGRLASAILNRMNLSDLVVKSEEEYVDLAVKLATDTHYRKNVQTRMAQARAVLYNDIEPVRALEVFLEKVVQKKILESHRDHTDSARKDT